MSEDEKRIEQPDRVIDILEEILEFNRKEIEKDKDKKY